MSTLRPQVTNMMESGLPGRQSKQDRQEGRMKRNRDSGTADLMFELQQVPISTQKSLHPEIPSSKSWVPTEQCSKYETKVFAVHCKQWAQCNYGYHPLAFQLTNLSGGGGGAVPEERGRVLAFSGSIHRGEAPGTAAHQIGPPYAKLQVHASRVRLLLS
jgi:hypothetical protein